MTTPCKFCQDEGGDMITCSTCRGYCHPSCLELPEHIVPVAKTYDWQCNDCKYCYECHNIENERKILFCDSCDRGFHIYCLHPRLGKKPKGDWYCAICLGPDKLQESRESKRLRNKTVEVFDESLLEVETIVQKEKETKKGKKAGKINDTETTEAEKEQESEVGDKKQQSDYKKKTKKQKVETEERDSKDEEEEEDGKLTDIKEKKGKGKEKKLGKEKSPIKVESSDGEKSRNAHKDVNKEKEEKAKGSEKAKGAEEDQTTDKEQDTEKGSSDKNQDKTNVNDTQQAVGSNQEKKSPANFEDIKNISKNKKQDKVDKDRDNEKNVNTDVGNIEEKMLPKEGNIEDNKKDKIKEIVEENFLDIKEIEKLKEKGKGKLKEQEKVKELNSNKDVEKSCVNKKDKMEDAMIKELDNKQNVEKPQEKEKIKVEAKGKKKVKEKGKDTDGDKGKEKTTGNKEPVDMSSGETSSWVSGSDNSSKKDSAIIETIVKSNCTISKSPINYGSLPECSTSQDKTDKIMTKGDLDKEAFIKTLKTCIKSVPIDINKSSKKKCVYGKKFSEGNQNQCPFYGCDGTGNTRNNHTSHLSLNSCPLSKESRKRERELLNSSKEESFPSPPKKKFLQSVIEPEKPKEVKKNEDSVNQTPIGDIVSSTDIQLFDQAKSEAVMALCEEMAPNPDGLKSVILGDMEINAWYKSQYSMEYSKLPKLYICEYCLTYMKTRTIYERHTAKCKVRNPPGDEIYRKDNLSVFEVNGATATAYCQNLCLMAKLFLDHKTLWLDVAPFLFYIMTINDESGFHIVGYFSKEKVSFLNYNVSCILVLPHHMKKGYGRLLIDFSYLLTTAEGKTGSPERPLSDMGLISYRKFWAEKLLKYLIDYQDKEISVKAISESMAIQANDVISTLQYLGLLKYWKGKHLILLRKEVIVEYALKVKGRPEDYKEIDPSCLTWTPPSAKT